MPPGQIASRLPFVSTADILVSFLEGVAVRGRDEPAPPLRSRDYSRDWNGLQVFGRAPCLETAAPLGRGRRVLYTGASDPAEREVPGGRRTRADRSEAVAARRRDDAANDRPAGRPRGCAHARC